MIPLRFVLPALLAMSIAPIAARAQSETPDPDEAKPAAAQTEDLPDAASLFEGHIEAIGGRDAVFSVRNRRISGIYSGIPFLFPVRLEVWQDAPDKYRLRLDEPAGRTIEVRYDGEVGWRMVSGNDEVEKLEGVSLRELVDTADFYGQANYDTRYDTIETIGSADINEIPVYIVRAVWPEGHTQFLFFHRETNHFVGSRYATIGPDGSAREVVIMVHDYEEVANGVSYPTRVTQLLAGESEPIVLKYKSIEFDADDGHDDYGQPDPE